MISLNNLIKSFTTASGVLEVLKGITLQIDRGEFVALTGASGSGKSTLLAMAGCLDKPTSGSIKINGNDLGKLTDNQAADLRSQTIGFVFQAFHLIQSLSIVENVEVPLFYAGVQRSKRRGMALKALERVGLAARHSHKPFELSGGEQQRAAIARALIRDPEVILADEPTGNLDSRTCSQIMDILEGLRISGKTVLLVTHDLAIASRSQRQIRLSDGRIESDIRQVLVDQTMPAEAGVMTAKGANGTPD